MLKPTWATDGVELYLGDCLDILPQFEPGSIHAVVTDPPYGVNNDCSYNARGLGEKTGKHWPARDWPQIHGDNRPFDPSPILALNLPTILWGANYYADKLPPSGWLVWDKEKPDQLDQSTCEVAWVSFKKNIRRFRHLWNGLCRATEVGEHYHATQKPIALMLWCLSFLPDAETVLDPFMGSGTTIVACIRTGRRAIGIEREKKYFDIAVERCKRELERFPLFTEEKPLKQGVLLPDEFSSEQIA